MLFIFHPSAIISGVAGTSRGALVTGPCSLVGRPCLNSSSQPPEPHAPLQAARVFLRGPSMPGHAISSPAHTNSPEKSNCRQMTERPQPICQQQSESAQRPPYLLNNEFSENSRTNTVEASSPVSASLTCKRDRCSLFPLQSTLTDVHKVLNIHNPRKAPLQSALHRVPQAALLIYQGSASFCKCLYSLLELLLLT